MIKLPRPGARVMHIIFRLTNNNEKVLYRELMLPITLRAEKSLNTQMGFTFTMMKESSYTNN
jgi:hypothetical protein